MKGPERMKRITLPRGTLTLLSVGLLALGLPRCGDRVVGLDCLTEDCVPPGGDGDGDGDGSGAMGGDDGSGGIGGAGDGSGGNSTGGTGTGGNSTGGTGTGGNSTGGTGDGGGGLGGAGGDAGTGGGDGGCPLGTTECGDECVDVDGDADNCGSCGTECIGSEQCVAGTCEPSCTLPRIECSGLCVDTESNNRFCGDCGTACGVGEECVNSACSPGVPGHVILLGHGFENAPQPMQVMLANGIFLPSPANDPVSVLSYEGDANASIIDNVDGAIDAVAAGARAWTNESVGAMSVSQKLAVNDAFLVYPQTNVSDAELRALGFAWSSSLNSFVKRGGSIIVLDGPGANSWQILDAAGLLDIESKSAVSNSLQVKVVKGGDALAAAVDLEFPVVDQTFSYVGGDVASAVAVSSDAPSVLSSPPEHVILFHRFVAE